MTEPRVVACGKQILLDGAHLADARDPEAAEVIVTMLQHGNLCLATPLAARERVEGFFNRG